MSQLARQFKWGPTSGNNYILRIDDAHFISYNPHTGADHFGAALDSIIGESGEETALVDETNEGHKYRILRGDWRDDYEKLVPIGFDACVEFFMENRAEHGGQWSTHEKDRVTK